VERVAKAKEERVAAKIEVMQTPNAKAALRTVNLFATRTTTSRPDAGIRGAVLLTFAAFVSASTLCMPANQDTRQRLRAAACHQQLDKHRRKSLLKYLYK